MPAQFVLCHCRKHGYIELADGFRGGEVCCKEHAFFYVRTSIKWGRMTDEEAAHVTKQILDSPLPEKLEEAPADLQYHAHEINALRSFLYDRNPGLEMDFSLTPVHELLHRPISPEDIPPNLVADLRAVFANLKVN